MGLGFGFENFTDIVTGFRQGTGEIARSRFQKKQLAKREKVEKLKIGSLEAAAKQAPIDQKRKDERHELETQKIKAQIRELDASTAGRFGGGAASQLKSYDKQLNSVDKDIDAAGKAMEALKVTPEDRAFSKTDLSEAQAAEIAKHTPFFSAIPEKIKNDIVASFQEEGLSQQAIILKIGKSKAQFERYIGLLQLRDTISDKKNDLLRGGQAGTTPSQQSRIPGVIDDHRTREGGTRIPFRPPETARAGSRKVQGDPTSALNRGGVVAVDGFEEVPKGDTRSRIEAGRSKKAPNVEQLAVSTSEQKKELYEQNRPASKFEKVIGGATEAVMAPLEWIGEKLGEAKDIAVRDIDDNRVKRTPFYLNFPDMTPDEIRADLQESKDKSSHADHGLINRVIEDSYESSTLSSITKAKPLTHLIRNTITALAKDSPDAFTRMQKVYIVNVLGLDVFEDVGVEEEGGLGKKLSRFDR